MRLVWEDDAWEDYLYWQTQDRKILKRVNLLIKDIRRSPFDGIGKPEPLKHNLSGWWSRRIDDIDRIVYYERDGIIYIGLLSFSYQTRQTPIRTPGYSWRGGASMLGRGSPPCSRMGGTTLPWR